MSETLNEQVQRVVQELNPEERRLFQYRLEQMVTRKRALARFPSPGHLAKYLIPDTVQTPLMDALDRVLIAADSGAQRRWIVNTPPQEGKTSRFQVGGLWLLLREPHRRIVYASYEQGIAARSSLQVRQWIEQHGSGYRGAKHQGADDVLGLTLDPDISQQSNWQLAEVPGRRNGGMVAVGVGSAFTGRPADVVFIDDPLKDAKAARSPVQRKAVIDWYQAVVLTRLPPSAIVVVVQTRWHEEDLSGWLIQHDDFRDRPEWGRLIVPARAVDDDPLGRTPGEWLVSTRGRSRSQWRKRAEEVGARWFPALYQQRPTAPEGGVFQRSWFDRDRVRERPELAYVMVMVDPADNDGTGDESGIVTGGLGADGRYYILEDDSGHFTKAQWMRRALFAAIRWNAARIGYEQSLSGLRRAFRVEWKLIRHQARVLDGAWSALPAPVSHGERPGAPPESVLKAALEELSQAEDSDAERTQLRAQLAALWRYVPDVLAMTDAGPNLKAVAAVGNKIYRAEMVAPMYENRLVGHLGIHDELEHQMATWQPPADSPDRMDAGVHLLTVLSAMSGAGAKVKRPTGAQLPQRAPARVGTLNRAVASRR